MAGAFTIYPRRPRRHSDMTVLGWSFAMGSVLVLSFIFLYVRFQHFHANHFLWEVHLTDLMVTLIGSGLLVGCVAVIANHLMRFRS